MCAFMEKLALQLQNVIFPKYAPPSPLMALYPRQPLYEEERDGIPQISARTKLND